jgi:hypothetical protein
MPFYRPALAPLFLPDMRVPLVVSILDRDMEEDGRTTAALMERFGYRDAVERLDIEVPADFRTDFASIPAWARWLFPPFGRHAKAAVLHDWLYAIGQPGRKAVADRVFRHAMTELEVDGWRIFAMYWAVRLGGRRGYAGAARDWASSFADGETGSALPPRFLRESAFVGQPNGPRPF